MSNDPREPDETLSPTDDGGGEPADRASPPLDNAAPQAPACPSQIGRYRVERLLGKGGFGLVYLAHDDQLRRQVAIKVPHRELTSQPADAEAYLDEARMLAHLDHPHIVPVHDVGSTVEFPCFFVSKYIDGTSLASRIKKAALTYAEAAELTATVAEALHYAHKQGLVHRDIKPGNILIDRSGKPYVVDFGLALREAELGKGPRYAGTPAYMSPEQARGEGHRVDGRSDIYSLGVVLYESLTGRRTFTAGKQQELLELIAGREPKPPRQIDDHIPKELERICLKALSRRARDRYTTAQDLAEDLRHFASQPAASPAPTSAQADTTLQPGADSKTPRGDSATRASDSRPIRIVPKGLRSFDEHDADFFLELLPGPRDRDGLPDSLRFWKSRIEEPDADKTFSVGLLYGPSGCGKSSVIKAGLLPRLSRDVVAVYVESTAQDTESRLLNGLRKRCPGLPRDLDLQQTLTALRRGQGIASGQKVLIVLDQFEQWLHARTGEEDGDLIQALRQCDGCQVQCLVMVRDDFWMAATRFMRELEIRLVEGHNSAAVDLFPARHAERVLAAFGRAFGALPEHPIDTTADQQQFVQQAVAGLAEEGKVISVRLALFAEMLKGRPWVPRELKKVGGTEGVGVTFLEETFSASTSPPEHRHHQKEARKVLKALLPESGTNIRCHMRSYEDLLGASGYANRLRDFDQLLEILDSQLRLITPTDPEGVEAEVDTASEARSGQKHYQLTHDYLVPSLRDWLTRKQKETRRGRAELRLAERASLWNAKPENRHLPSWWEYLSIASLTARRNWTEPQRKMMRRAGRVLGVRWSGALLVALLIGSTVQLIVSSVRHRTLLERTQTAVAAMSNSRGVIVPRAIADLKELPRQMVLDELHGSFADSPENRKLALAYALADFGDVPLQFLVSHVENASAAEIDNLAAALGFKKNAAVDAVKAAASRAEGDWPYKARLAILALYLGDPSLAADMLQVPDRPDPIQRTVFIDTLAAWHGDVAKLAGSVAGSDNGSLRSGIALGVGSAAQIDETSKAECARVLSDWHVHQPDSVTHSASGWVLRQWKLPEPTIEPRDEPQDGQDWMVTKMGLTLIHIAAGQFLRRDEESTAPGFALLLHTVRGSNAQPQKVTLTRDFWLSDREVSVALFRAFVEDKKYTGQRPRGWSGENKEISPRPTHPVQEVSWYDAVMFCNWLSVKEGRTPSYVLWRLVDGASGYRLPLEAEWEYACRTGTTTGYASGDDEKWLSRYGVFRSERTEPVGTKLCNGWGLFDMHGNVWEWCADWHGQYASGTVADPWGPETLSGRVLRGGGWDCRGEDCRSAVRSDAIPASQFSLLGFRVARSPSGSEAGRDSPGSRRTLATDIVPDYAAAKPERLADLVLSGQTNQFKTLFPVLRKHGPKAVALLESELDRMLKADWQDPPRDPAWAKRSPQAVQWIQAAQGMVEERFAFCQSMPLAEFLQVAETLRSAGYRPVRFRPYSVGDAVQVAAVWSRDGREWRLDHGLDADQMRQREAELAAEGLIPVDVAGYLTASPTGTRSMGNAADSQPTGAVADGTVERYAAIWVQRLKDEPDARMYVGATNEDHEVVYQALEKEKFEFQQTLQAFRGLDGQQKYCGIKRLQAGTWTGSWNSRVSEYAEMEYLDKTLGDICVSQDAPPRERRTQLQRQRLAEAEKQLAVDAGDRLGRLARAESLSFLGDHQAALADLMQLIAADANFLAAYRLRALTYAMLGDPEKVKADLAQLERLGIGTAERDGWQAICAAGEPGRESISAKPPDVPNTLGPKATPDAAGVVDLLPFVSPKTDAVSGTWTRTRFGLVSPVALGARIELPFTPPKHYTLRLVVTPFANPPEIQATSLTLGLVMGTRRFQATFDWNGVSALEDIDGKNIGNNSTTYRERVLTDGQTATIECEVDEGSVQVRRDGQTIIDWSGESGQLALNNYWKTPHEDALFVGAYQKRFQIHSITISYPDGQLKKQRDLAPVESLQRAHWCSLVAAVCEARKNTELAARYQQQAAELLADSVRSVPGVAQEIADDPLLAFVPSDRESKDQLRYAAVWQDDTKYESRELYGLAPQEHVDRCRELAKQGYRPAAMSAVLIDAKESGAVFGQKSTDEAKTWTENDSLAHSFAASIWQRPLVPDDAKETLAQRQANAGIGLLRMSKPDRVWPLLQHQRDPRLQTWLIHRMAPLGVDAGVLAQRLAEETDVSIRRALILSLGEFEARGSGVGVGQRDNAAVNGQAGNCAQTPPGLEHLTDNLRDLYRNDPNPGIHAAAEWLLRRWGQADELAKIDLELATGEIESNRQWYVSAQGQTLVVIRGPVEFEMGSPAGEEGRQSVETLHRRQINRTYAIATKETTVEQYKRFQPDFGHDQMDRCPEPSCPILGVTWYEAVQYCNTLSEQEGLAADQWCYVPNASGQFAEGMSLAPNWLERTGYRLPTEAEWEYACRAGAGTRFSYGRARELLGRYAWYFENSNERSWPVGQLRPNGLGLFDAQGNAAEWCQDWYQSYGKAGLRADDGATASGEGSDRVLRGGSWNGGAGFCRSADRFRFSPGEWGDARGFRVARSSPDDRGDALGFRVARSLSGIEAGRDSPGSEWSLEPRPKGDVRSEAEPLPLPAEVAGAATPATGSALVRTVELEAIEILAGQRGSSNFVTFRDDGRELLVTSAERTLERETGALRLWKLGDASAGVQVSAHTTSFFAGAVSPDGKRLALGDQAGSIWICDLANVGERRLVGSHAPNETWSLVFRHDGRRLVSAGKFDGRIRIWDVETSERVLEFSVKREREGRPLVTWIDGVPFSPDGTRIAAPAEGDQVKLWDAESGKELLALPGHQPWANGVAFSPDGTHLSVVTEGGEVKVWDLESRRTVSVLSGHQGPAIFSTFHANGQLLVTTGFDGTVHVWDPASGRSLAILRGLTSGVPHAAFSPDGRHIAAGDWDGNLRIWDISPLLPKTSDPAPPAAIQAK